MRPAKGSTCVTCRPGTSKWIKIEHRLLSHFTTNWRSRPLNSHEVMLRTITATSRTSP
ncbi:hypothetical protein [Streptomyces sp. NPDC094468]|uniref:ISAzo13-like element transposase-related protein n=1 Tax=Streptomyces sp. NPDC094468 TaxID=3366066 RepID=UPI00380C4EA4